MSVEIFHAVRRGLSHPVTTKVFKRMTEDGDKIEMPKWGIAILVVTFVVFVVFLSSLEYTLRHVVAPLTMVETPGAAITVTPSEEDPDKDVKEGLLENGPTITVVQQKPITTSIRGTLNHIVSVAGRTARWRGILASILYSLAFSIVANLIELVVPRFVPLRLIWISGAAGALLANLHAAWTHKVISMPSNKRVWQRIPSKSSWRQLALPAAVKSSAGYMAFYVAQLASLALGLHRQQNFENGKSAACYGLRVLGVAAVAIATSLFLVLPAVVTQIRVEASVLPEEEDTIVPFDRTFNGKVVPKILGGTGAVSFLEAWRSFNWEARRRIIKLYVKIFAIVFVVALAFAHLIALEFWAIMGPQVGKMIAQAKHHAAGN